MLDRKPRKPRQHLFSISAIEQRCRRRQFSRARCAAIDVEQRVVLAQLLCRPLSMQAMHDGEKPVAELRPSAPGHSVAIAAAGGEARLQ